MSARDRQTLLVARVVQPKLRRWHDDLEVATAVLDALLPQIKTAEQLAALPDGAHLLGSVASTMNQPRRPEVWHTCRDTRERADMYIRAFGPFTLLTPEEDS